jgi:RHH-type transcriptional regulator, rel operon repressor / antitoxin RelB
MADSTTMTIRLDEELKARLDRLARTMHRSKSYLAAEALREYVELNEWQLEELQAAVKEAGDEDYASAEDIRAVLSKWGMNGD